MTISDEVGRELKAHELVPRTVVVVKPPDRSVFVTFWVTRVEPDYVAFYSDDLRWTVLNFVQPDGTITDDRGRQVRVFEYLGKI